MGLFPAGTINLFSSPKRPDRYCGPPCLLFSGHWGHFHGSYSAGSELDLSPASNAEVKNGYGYTSAPPHEPLSLAHGFCH